MLKVTSTVRELKNRDTGIDVVITGCKEEANLLTVKLEYRIVVVSNLSCFKTDKHRPGEVVQFVINKTEEQFIDLHRSLVAKYGLVELPSISPTGVAIFHDINVRKQKEDLERFLKMVVSTPHVATCYLTLEFLGVNPVIAGNFNQNLEQEKSATSGQRNTHDIFEEEVEEEDIFLNNSTTSVLATAATNNVSSDLFSDVSVTNRKFSSKIFDDQDYGDENEDISELLLPGALTEAPQMSEEDNSELLQIDDDLDKILNLGKKRQELVTNKKPEVSKKPTLPPKPGNKPSLPPKPTGNSNARKHPALKQSINNNSSSSKNSSNKLDELFVSDDLGAGDILKYIQDQTNKQAEEVDLFS